MSGEAEAIRSGGGGFFSARGRETGRISGSGICLAAIQLLAQQPQAALITLGPLLAGEHPDPESLELASAAYESAKQTPQAVATLRQAILLDPKDVNLYLDFANLSFAHESFQVGIDVINDGVELQPQAAPLYFARGVLYVSLAQYDKAEVDFQKAYELDPVSPSARRRKHWRRRRRTIWIAH